MLKQLYLYGSSDSEFDLDPALLAGDLDTIRAGTIIQGLKAGRLATVNDKGYVRLAVKTDYVPGFIINDAAGYSFENTPAIASGKVPLLSGGGLVETDQVVEGDIKAGTPLYVGADGMVTKVKASDSVQLGISRSENSATDKTLRVQF